ncbi:hypothetical protein [Lactococcus ileimucosae]|uniref:Lipoprotein n=1 Tax=Lactococcus ileimucosae TaxID=2941329 RepID=A0ABV4D4E2_9LACT|nr:hypothetical protein [Lactococcus ileimucosae]
MKKFKLPLLIVSSFATLLLLVACGNNTNAKKDTNSESSSSVKSSASDTNTSSDTKTSESTDTASSTEAPKSPTTESSDTGWVDNSNNPVENNGAGGHSPQADSNASSSHSESDTVGHSWVLVYVDKSGNKHESTVSTSYKELQDKANALLASGEATSYYFIQK